MVADNRFALAACAILILPSCQSRQFRDTGSALAGVTSHPSVATKRAAPGVHRVAECNGCSPDDNESPVREHALVNLFVSRSAQVEHITRTLLVQTRNDSGAYVPSLAQFQGVPASVYKDENGVVRFVFRSTTGTRTLNGKVSILRTVAELVLDADDSMGPTKNVVYQFEGDNAMQFVCGCTFTAAPLL